MEFATITTLPFSGFIMTPPPDLMGERKVSPPPPSAIGDVVVMPLSMERCESSVLWLVYLGAGLPMLALSHVDVFGLLVSISIVGTAALMSYRFGGLGGADVKGMLALSVVLHQHMLAVWAVLIGSCVALVLSRRYGDDNPFMLSLLVGIVAALMLDIASPIVQTF
ncbi:MAG: hypothetical protein ACXQT3_01475 [Methermicoccaceae archaeon]